MSYSQIDEERYILEAVGGIAGDPQFLDIGAWNPFTFSNTRTLYEKGWRGVMVEPSPEPMLSLLKEYGIDARVTLLNAAVGIEKSLSRLYVTADAVSTTSEETRTEWKDDGGYYGSMLVPTITLEEIFNQFAGFQFINIDAEGLSVDLFLRLLALGHRPDCICVEIDNRMGEVASNGTSAGYKMVYANGTNAVFAK